MKSPKITVVITCHDLGRYLREAVDSALHQTFQDFEIIVVDDSSTDRETVDLLAHLDTPKIRVIHVEKRNVSAARNCGIRESRGKYICCLDADDVLKPTYLEKAVIILDKEPTIGFVGCWYEAFGKELWTFKPESASLNDFLVENRAPIVSLFRREVWDEAGGYDERLEGYEDWEFWINILAHGYGYGVLKEILFRYRVRSHSKIKESNLPENREKIMAVIIEKHRNIFKKNAIPIFIGKEKLIGDLLAWTRKQEEVKRWFIETNKEHEKYIRELLDVKEWFLQQLENYKAAMAQQQAELVRQGAEIAQQRAIVGRQRDEIARQRGEIARYQADIARLNAEVAYKQSTIDMREHELRSVYLSKVWKLGCAFRDAKGSLRGALLLPFKIIDLGCPDTVKRMVKKVLLIGPHETVRKNFYKLPYRLMDRVIPRAIKGAIPCWLKNMARAVFRTTNKRLYKQKKWEGPLVSVVITCYNYGGFIEEALDSVLDQTFLNYEIIIVDDGSTDPSTRDIIEKIRSRNIPNLRVIYQANQGLPRARNNGIEVARGKYICCLDADDTLEPSYLEKCLVILEGENRDICYSYFNVFGDEQWMAKTADFDIDTLKYSNCVCGAAVFKKSWWKKVGGYNSTMRGGYEDWDFWISVAERGARGKVIPEPLFNYRRHGRTMLTDAAIRHNMLYERIRKNHPLLYGKNKYVRTCITYHVINPWINLVNSVTGNRWSSQSRYVLPI